MFAFFEARTVNCHSVFLEVVLKQKNKPQHSPPTGFFFFLYAGMCPSFYR